MCSTQSAVLTLLSKKALRLFSMTRERSSLQWGVMLWVLRLRQYEKIQLLLVLGYLFLEPWVEGKIWGFHDLKNSGQSEKLCVGVLANSPARGPNDSQHQQPVENTGSELCPQLGTHPGLRASVERGCHPSVSSKFLVHRLCECYKTVALND